MKTKILLLLFCLQISNMEAQDLTYMNEQFSFKIDFPNQYEIQTSNEKVIKIVSKDPSNFFMMTASKLEKDIDRLTTSRRTELLEIAKNRFVQSIGIQKFIENWAVSSKTGYHLVIYNEAYDLDLDYYLVFKANHLYQYTIVKHAKNEVNNMSVKSLKLL